MKKMLFLVLSGLLLTSCIKNPERPKTYDEFTVVKNSTELIQALKEKDYIFLAAGEYVLPNPITIERDTPLYIHGAGRHITTLQGANPAKPLFVVNKGTLINVAGMDINKKYAQADHTGMRSFLFKNKTPLSFEIYDCSTCVSTFDIKGPGRFVFQSIVCRLKYAVETAVLVDHPGAEVWYIGGGIINGGKKRLSDGEKYHLWQKQGRLIILGASTGFTEYSADFCIESRSKLGPHFVNIVRSEGLKYTRAVKEMKVPPMAKSSRILYVPKTDEKVDVVLVGNFLCGKPFVEPEWHKFMEYNGAGTVWLIGNIGNNSNRLIFGDCPKATIVAMGNGIMTPQLCQVNTDKVITAGNRYHHRIHSLLNWDPNDKTAIWERGNREHPRLRFCVPHSTVDKFDHVPEVPKLGKIPKLTRPKVTATSFKKLGLISVKDFGAKGDGKTDDTAALQQAFSKVGHKIFIPFGTYITTDTIYFHHLTRDPVVKQKGGWIAGVGNNESVIKNISDRGVFCSEGFYQVTVQDICFKGKEYGREVTFRIENNRKLKGIYSHGCNFYRCRFHGGKYGLSFGLSTGALSSENFSADCTFAKCRQGVAVGSFNALNEFFNGCKFIENDIAIGTSMDETENHGGNFHILSAEFIKSRKWDVDWRRSHYPWWFHDLTSNSKRFCNAKFATQRHEYSEFETLCILDESKFTGKEGKEPMFYTERHGTLIFLHSEVDGGWIKFTDDRTMSTVISLDSKITNWDKTVLTNDNSYMYKIK